MNIDATIVDGSLLLASPLALAAGLVSFVSPCVLPLVPGYLSYITGFSAAEVFDEPRARRGRLVLGALLFVAGFALVFVSAGVLLGSLGGYFLENQDTLQRWLGGVTILFGLTFFGRLPWLQRDVRIHRKPAVGLAGAPVLGVLFGLGWTPCVGPTLGAVMALGIDSGTATRGGLLAVTYSLGLGLPFVVTALAFDRAMGAFSWVRRHNLAFMRAGGVMLVVIGLLLVTGLWNDLTVDMRVWATGFTPSL